MLRLGIRSTPGNAAELQSVLEGALDQSFAQARGGGRVMVRGELPRLEGIRVDLSRTELGSAEVGGPSGRTLDLRAQMSVAGFELHARPLLFKGATLKEVAFHAREATFDWATDSDRVGWFTFAGSAEGTFKVDAAAGELEHLFWQGLKNAGAKYGISIEGGSFSIHQVGPAAIAFRAEATGRKAILRGTAVVSGRLHLDETLTLRLSALECASGGGLGRMIVPLLQPQLAQWEGRVIPLLGRRLSVKGCRRTLMVGSGSALAVEVSFDSALRA